MSLGSSDLVGCSSRTLPALREGTTFYFVGVGEVESK